MTSSDLPRNWAWASLAELGEWRGGGTPSKANPSFWNGAIPWASPKDMKVPRLLDTEDHITPKAIDASATSLIPSQSVVLVTRSGILAHTLPVATTEVPLTINQDLKAVTPCSGIDPYFVAWAIRAQQNRILNHCSKDGTTVHSIEMSRLYDFKIPLAPAREQRRIVAKIEELFSELDNGIDSLHSAREQLNAYRQKLLIHAFEGRLTAPWRQEKTEELESADQLLARITKERQTGYRQQVEEWKKSARAWEIRGREGVKPKPPLKPKSLPALPEQDLQKLGPLPSGWRWARLGEIASVGTGVTPLKSNSEYYKDGNIPWVTSGALNQYHVRHPSGHVTLRALNETNLRLYPPHTLLVALYGEGKTRGKCSELLIEAATNQAIAAIVLEGEAVGLRNMLKWFLTMNYEKLRFGSSGGVQPNLNLGIIENTPVPVCSVAEANQISELLEATHSVVEQQVRELSVQIEKSEALRHSILKRAFVGRLVPQDARDEPASILLARINSERTDVVANSKGKNTRRRKKSTKKKRTSAA